MQPRMHLHTSQLADPHAGRTPGAVQALLRMFVGRWQIEGQNSLSAPTAKGSAVHGEDVYEMMPGGFFLRGEWQHGFDQGEHIGSCMLGFHPDKGSLCAHTYDNLGFTREYVLTVRDRTWRFAGRYERATYVFAEDGRSFEQHWEISRNGLAWQPLCDMVATLVDEVRATGSAQFAIDREAIARQCYEAYSRHDRALLEPLLGPNLKFTSPYDDAIDRATYFTRCWPGNIRMKRIEVERVLLDGDDAVVVTYTLVTASGRRIHNTERLWFKDGMIDRVEVFFGTERDAAGAFLPMRRD
ncbi:MAG: DUF1579 family protein [Kofleriaceae bacterium]|nr:DUF1579 family protein [Kofleriaceae bacterium]